jgi:hypothetical protein
MLRAMVYVTNSFVEKVKALTLQRHQIQASASAELNDRIGSRLCVVDAFIDRAHQPST